MRPAVKPIKSVVLCVEDNESHLRLRRAVLEKNGYSVLAATSASEALQMLRTSSVLLVISDHMLAGLTGTELAKEIRKIRPHVPIMLYSGIVPEHLDNVDCFLSKAEPVEKFLSMVRDLVSRGLG
ncbi:MAG: hypothetical protein DMG71_13420 [Acidobacteria bacterium]|nr:MAG: hypothetical protein DMG71_13420 [Acidobacteriota bacterium]